MFDLITDPKEEYPATGMRNSWVAGPAMNVVTDFEASLKKYPRSRRARPIPMLRRYADGISKKPQRL